MLARDTTRNIYIVWVGVCCMDQSIVQTTRRAKRIHVVQIALLEVKQKKRLLDEEAFIIDICNQFNCSERTAKEYIKIAKSRIKGGMMDKDWARPDPIYDKK